jgi:tetratricopeptide (TPR) repeat protein
MSGPIMHQPTLRLLGLPLLLLLLLAGAGCATTAPSTEGAEHVRMDPIIVRDQTDPLTGLDGYDASQLLERGNQLYSAADYPRAAQVFEKLVSTFPDSELVPSALYNAGLAYEQLGDFTQALERFTRVMNDHPSSSSAKDALYRSAFSHGKLAQWKEVADTFWAIRQRADLSVMDEIEARVGMSVGLFMQEDYASAEKELMSAVRFYEEKSKDEFLPADYFIGQARFYLGEINAREFERVELSVADTSRPGWEEMMGEKLEEKCDLLIRAQNNFIRTIRVGHTGWATAAGYRIGSLYERLYDDVLEVPVPAGLSDGGKEYYLGEVRKKVGVLVSKAIKIYEQSLEMATRVGEKNEWVDRTSKSLERMKSLYLTAMAEPTGEEG